MRWPKGQKADIKSLEMGAIRQAEQDDLLVFAVFDEVNRTMTCMTMKGVLADSFLWLLLWCSRRNA